MGEISVEENQTNVNKLIGYCLYTHTDLQEHTHNHIYIYIFKFSDHTGPSFRYTKNTTQHNELQNTKSTTYTTRNLV